MKYIVADRIEELSKSAGDLLDNGCHCSEAVMKSIGEAYFPEYGPFLSKISNGFRGGVAKTRENMCGAFSAGVILLGASRGRESEKENDEAFLETVKEFKKNFISGYGTLNCQELVEKREADGEVNCRRYVELAVRLLAEQF